VNPPKNLRNNRIQEIRSKLEELNTLRDSDLLIYYIETFESILDRLAEIISCNIGATFRPLLKLATYGITRELAEEKYHISLVRSRIFNPFS
jgi:hypothetical protein